MPPTDAERHDNLYAELLTLIGYNAASLRAQALFLNQHKKNRDFMKAATIELGRNARHMARAVDYFPPYFQDDTLTAEQIKILFAYARASHEKAIEAFAKYKFDYPLYRVHEIMHELTARKPRENKCDKCEWKKTK